MSRIDTHTTVDLFFQVNWTSGGVAHTDAYAGHQSNFWRDLIPSRLRDNLMGKRSGDTVSETFEAQELLGSMGKHDMQTVKRRQFKGDRINMNGLSPRVGRFYPKGVLADVAGIFRANMSPFRCVSKQNGHLGIAMGHPLAGKRLDVQATVGSIRSTLEERGGTLRDWGEIITQGVGMQARCEDQPTDFFSDQPFERNDSSPDDIFYAKPRLVQHLDDTAIDILRQLYGRFLNSGERVLDLMSSWSSHLPEDKHPGHVDGLGLNEVELRKNTSLDSWVVHDLNAHPRLPYDDHSFNTVLCSVSVEYLITPVAVFSEVARVLQSGGHFVVSFSNRWFAPKAIRVWSELNEFERMGLVLEYFRHDQHFDNLGTYSIRGLSRPEHDKYYEQLPFSDPVYAVWGRKI